MFAIADIGRYLNYSPQGGETTGGDPGTGDLMSDYAKMAQVLTDSLKLQTAPVAVCFTDTPPKDVPAHPGMTPTIQESLARFSS